MNSRVCLGLPGGCQLTFVGKWNGCDVKAATDSMGPQIIVIGPGHHLLSFPFKNHDEAVEAAKLVVEQGPKALNGGFINLLSESPTDAMLRLAFSLTK